MRNELQDRIYYLVDKYGKLVSNKFEKKRLFKLKKHSDANMIDSDIVFDSLKLLESSKSGKESLNASNFSADSKSKKSDDNSEKWDVRKNEYELYKKTL